MVLIVISILSSGLVGGLVGLIAAYYLGFPFTDWQVWHDWPYEEPFWAHRTLRQWYRAFWHTWPFGFRGGDPRARLPEEE